MTELETELQIKVILNDERNRGKEEGKREMKDTIFYWLKSKVVTLKGNVPVVHADYIKNILDL
jgi:hypothetical protein